MSELETLSSFYVFAVSTTADANKVTANFSAFRGHFFPIDPNTTTAAVTKTFDIGSSEHRWRNIYSQSCDLSNTNTSVALIQGLSSGAFSFRKDGVECFRITERGFIGTNITPTGATSTAVAGQVARSSVLNSTLTSSGLVAGSTCTLTTVGRKVMIGLFAGTSTSNSFIGSLATATNAAESATWTLAVSRNGAVVSAITQNANTKSLKFPGGIISTVDVPAAGTHNYSLNLTALFGSGSPSMYFNNLRLVAWEF